MQQERYEKGLSVYQAIDMDLSEDELFNKYSIQLYDALVSGKGLMSMLNTAEEIFGNPILIADASFKVLAHVEPQQFEDALWKQIIYNGYYPSQYMHVLTGDSELYEHVFSGETPVILTDAGAPNRYLSKMIKVDGKPVGFSTCIEYERAITPLDIRLFDLFCKVVGTELRAYDIAKQYHTQRYEYFISEMLSGPVKSDFIKERMKQVGLKLKSNLFVLVAEFRDEQIRREYQMEYFRSVFEQTVSLGHCIVYRNSLVMLISQDHRMEVSETFMNKVSAQLESFDMIAGISHRFRKVDDLNAYYKQACAAIKIGRRLEKDERLFNYGDSYYYHMLDILMQSEDLIKFCAPKLLDIIEYDTEYNTNYAMTAYVYFSTNRNPAQTARRLNIHRNTIDYRIKRLEELFYLDFNNNETIFSFELSFRIFRFLGIGPFNGAAKADFGKH